MPKYHTQGTFNLSAAWPLHLSQEILPSITILLFGSDSGPLAREKCRFRKEMLFWCNLELKRLRQQMKIDSGWLWARDSVNVYLISPIFFHNKLQPIYVESVLLLCKDNVEFMAFSIIDFVAKNWNRQSFNPTFSKSKLVFLYLWVKTLFTIYFVVTCVYISQTWLSQAIPLMSH